jgi:hypothetical protein
MSVPNNWGDWRPNLTPHTGDLQATDLIECTMIVGGLPVNTAITGQQIIDAASGGGAAGYYAMYQDNITQTAAVINTGYPIKFRTLDYSNGVSVVSDSRITIANTGVYNLQFSVQLENSSTQEHDVTIWLRKNGVDVTGSSGFVSVASSHGGVHGHVLPAWNYLLDVIGGDYYELVWSVSSTAVTMPYYSGSLPPPSAASAIFTVTQQAGIIAGTGMTALNGLSGAVQTISTGTTGTDFNVVSSGTDHKFNIPTASATNRGALSTTDWSTFNSKQATLVSGTNIKTINSTSLLGSGDIVIGGGGLTVGTTAIASGTVGRVLFEGTGNVLQEDAKLFWDNTNKKLGIGATPDTSTVLDVRSAGTLATDLAFRVRNSANTANLYQAQGDGQHWFNPFQTSESVNDVIIGGSNLASSKGGLRIATGNGALTLIGRSNAQNPSIISGNGNFAFETVANGTFAYAQFNVSVAQASNSYITILASNTNQNSGIRLSAGGNKGLFLGVVGTDFLNINTTSGSVNIGYGSSLNSNARLDVRAQGALSTDLAFRVRNSADTFNIIRANGVGDVFIGLGAGNVNTATQNTFIGLNAGLSNTTGAQNTVNGYYALRTNTTGQSNTANGAYALSSNTTGNNNIGIGYASLYLNTTAASNTAIGHSALYSNTTGGNNSALGFYALQNNTTAANNSALGFYALQSNTTGQSNAAIGSSSLFNNTTGGSNTAIGYASGAFIAGGVTGNTITTNSVYIGNNTKALANNQTNQIVIGDNATGAGSNTVTLGHTTIVKTILRGTINAANLPTSPAGLVTGDIWNNLGILTIV